MKILNTNISPKRLSLALVAIALLLVAMSKLRQE